MGGESDHACTSSICAKGRIIAIRQLTRKSIKGGLIVEVNLFRFCFRDLPDSYHDFDYKRSNPVGNNETISRINLDTLGRHSVNSLRWKISMKGAHCMSMFSINTILILSPDVAGVLLYRSAPIDH